MAPADERVYVVATVTPAEGKADRLAFLLGELCDWVEKNEPTTLRYQLHRRINHKGKEELVMYETYENMEAHETHTAKKIFEPFFVTVRKEKLVAGPIQKKFLKKEAGFMSRL